MAAEQPWLRRTYDMDEVARILGISRNHAYVMAREEAFPAIRLGRRLVIPRQQFDVWLAGDARAAAPASDD